MKDETPRTHAFLAENSSGFGMAIFARQLEREISAAKADLAKLRVHAEAMAEVLGWLNRLGGLGYDKHARIEAALVAYRAEFKGE